MKRTPLKRGQPLKRTGFTSKPKPMRKVSKKRKEHWDSDEGKAELEHMGFVKQLPCITCGAPPPSDAHHCKDDPPFDDNKGKGPYVRLSCANRKSSGWDTIPLCKHGCHQSGPNSFHDGTANFHRLHGKDYEYIQRTRDMVRAMKGETE